MFGRWVQPLWKRKLGTSTHAHIVFGARQTGKSTLLHALLPRASLWLDFSDPRQRSSYLRDPGRLIAECRALPKRSRPHVVVVDEAQNVPAIFDSVQHLYDADRSRWRFVLCGSSARKLRATGANLLPGRAVLHRLFPLIVAERPFPEDAGRADTEHWPLAFLPRPGVHDFFPPADLVERMTFGDLPGIALARDDVRADLLSSYAEVYLEEELRREGLIKDWPAFARFLELAALESGQMLNYANVSQEVGLSVPAVKSHYQLLEDMFLGFRVPAFSRSPRKNLLSTHRFFFFDLGLRHAAAGLALTRATALANPGPLFEQWVGIELWKRLQYLDRGRLHYLRSKSGAEVDFIVELGGKLFPIEVKWTENPGLQDARHLLQFLAEQPAADHGYVICRCSRPRALHDRVTALPWFQV